MKYLPVDENKDYIPDFLKQIESGDIEWRGGATADIARWRAFRYNVKPTIQAMRPWKAGRPYRVDPLPKRISFAYRDFIIADDPAHKPADEADLESQKQLLKGTKFKSRLKKGADICASEGQTWWRIYVNQLESEFPQVDFHSRMDVIPWTAGETILAVAFVTEYVTPGKNAETFRHLEIHQHGQVANYLYKADNSGGGGKTETELTKIQNSASESTAQGKVLGTRVPLTAYPRTENLEEIWTHDLPILAGVIRNGLYDESMYEGCEDFFLDLNEAHTVDAENFRLAGKKRAVMDKQYADQAGEADFGEEIFWVENDMNELDGNEGPFKVLQYDYDANASKIRKDDLEQKALTRAGLAKQLVDANASEGLAQTGTALRTRLMPTASAMEGMQAEWQDKVPVLVNRLQQVDNMATGNLGGGHQWKDPDTAPSVVLAAPLPVDAQEEAIRHQTLITAELESLETAIEEMRPGWTVERRNLEVMRIMANRVGYALDDAGNPITLTGASPATEPPTSGGPGENGPAPAGGSGPPAPGRPRSTQPAKKPAASKAAAKPAPASGAGVNPPTV